MRAASATSLFIGALNPLIHLQSRLTAIALLCTLLFSSCAQPPSEAHAVATDTRATPLENRDASNPSAVVTPQAAHTLSLYGEPLQVGKFEDANIDESSGIIASRANPNLYWTHNDSGDGAFLYLVDAHGKRRGVWRVVGAQALDWEDIATGKGANSNRPYLYIADIGDNTASRREVVVYRVPEPIATEVDRNSTKTKPRLSEPAEAIRLRYPDGAAHDAEAMFVHPTTGDLYIFIKTPIAPSVIYKASAPLQTRGVTTLRRVGVANIPSVLGGVLTGADINADGTRVVVCDYLAAYEWTLPADANSFDSIWQSQPALINIGARPQGEGICYSTDGESLIATSEGVRAPLFAVRR